MERALTEMLSSHSSLALAVCDAEGRVSMSTPALQRIVGFAAEGLTLEAVDHSVAVYEASGQRRLEPQELPLARALTGQVVKDQLCCLRRTDGALVVLRCNAAPLRDDRGTVRGAIVLVQDVTVEHTALANHAQLRDRLITTVNHELRTPMTLILGHAELLMDALDDPALAPWRQSITALARAGDQLAELADTITFLIDLQSASTLNRQPADLADVVHDVARARRAAALASGLGLDVEVTGPLRGEFDVQLVRRAVDELIDNAINHSPPQCDIRVRARVSRGAAEVEVTDLGPGIDAHERERLMQPFERGATHDPSDSSQGLGLAFAQVVATGHGGRLVLEANDPAGLVAKLVLGRHRQPAAVT